MLSGRLTSKNENDFNDIYTKHTYIQAYIIICHILYTYVMYLHTSTCDQILNKTGFPKNVKILEHISTTQTKYSLH